MANRMLRIAVVTETYPPEINGVAMTISRMVEGLRQRHVVELIRPRQNPQDSAKHEPSLQEVLVRGIPIPRYQDLKLGLPAKRQLIKLWTKQRPDVVHIVTEGPLGSSAIAAARNSASVSSDFHTNFHSYSRHYGFGWLQKTVSAYLRNLHNRTDTTLVPTRELRDTLAQDGYQNLQVVARGVDTALFHPGKRSEKLRLQWGVVADDELAVIYVGRISAEKNLPLVVRAFKAMQASNPKLKLVLVGDGPVRAELQRQNPEYIFAGMRTGEDLCGALCVEGISSCSEHDGNLHGNVTVEAMVSGLPSWLRYAAADEHNRAG